MKRVRLRPRQGPKGSEPNSDGRTGGIAIRRGSVEVRVYTTRNRVAGREYVRHEVVWYAPGGDRIKRRFSNFDEAKREAEMVATRLANLDSEAARMSGAEVAQFADVADKLKPENISLPDAVREFVGAKRRLPTGISLSEAVDFFVSRHPSAGVRKRVPEVVDEIIATKKAARVSAVHLRLLEARLRKFANSFPAEITMLTGAQVAAYVMGLKLPDGSPVKNRTKANTLTDLRSLFHFARRQRYVSRELAEEISEIPTPKSEVVETGIFTPDQMRQMLAAVDATVRPVLAIGAFCGLRTEELNRLEWHDVRLDERVIIVGADKAKTATRRVVPIPDNCRNWLQCAARREGRLNPAPDADALIDRIERVAARIGIRWVKNGLRHSFCSYRLALTHDPARVATEAGNSPTMVHRHYKALVTEAQANQWFTISPATQTVN